MKSVQLPRGPLPTFANKDSKVYLPMTAVIAVETYQTPERGVFQAFVSSTHLCGLVKAILPVVNQRFTVVGEGVALQGSLWEIYAIFRESGFAEKVSRSILETMSEVSIQRLSCVTHHSSTQRVALLLLEAQIAFGEERAITLSQQQIARFLGCRRATVSVALESLARDEIIDIGRSRITILDTHRVRRTACECIEAYLLSLKRYREKIHRS